MHFRDLDRLRPQRQPRQSRYPLLARLLEPGSRDDDLRQRMPRRARSRMRDAAPLEPRRYATELMGSPQFCCRQISTFLRAHTRVEFVGAGAFLTMRPRNARVG